MDIKREIKGVYLVGDNRKFIGSIPLREYDVIDLDAYGLAFDLIDYILRYDFNNDLSQRIFITFIQSVIGALPYKMLNQIGYTHSMIHKIPTLFYRDGIGKFKAYLGTIGVTQISIKSEGLKHYIFIQT